MGTTAPNDTFFMAEGYTGGSFDTWLLVQNPGQENAVVTFDFMLPSGQTADPFAIEVPAGARKSVRLNDLPGLESTDVSVAVMSDQPVIAERSMYFDYDGRNGGHCSAPAEFTGDKWYLAEVEALGL